MKKLFFLFIAILITGISHAQNVSIGHAVPVAKLDIRGVAANPTIPGFASTGIFRIGVNVEEGIDIGKIGPSGSSPHTAWIQAGHSGVADPLSLQPLGGNVGIGIVNTDPNAKLHVNGTLKIVDGTQGAGKILTSNATGLASWQPPPPPPPTYYPGVTICCQSWMTKNLDVSTYRNGDVIPKVTDAAAWAALTTGAYCYYNNDSTTYAATYGKLYNWYAVNDSRGLAPQGWHVPTDFEWTTLGNCLGGDLVAGGPMKEIGTTHWATPNSGATNLSGFYGLPGGWRSFNGSFAGIGFFGFWWSSTEHDSNFAWYRALGYNDDNFDPNNYNKHYGFSVRCLRD